MPRGLPDYYNPDTLVSQRLANVEEVVTALQGITNLDNRGRTLWFMPFNSTLNGWKLLTGGDGSVPAISTDTSLIEPSSLKMDAGTVSGSGSSRALRNFLILDIIRAGIETSIAWEGDLGELWASFQYDNGTNEVECTFKIDRPNSQILLWVDSAWVPVYTLPAYGVGGNWLIFKIVADFDKGYYSRLIVGLDEVDISAYPLFASASSLAGQLYTNLVHKPIDDGSNVAYLGHLNITVDEP